MEPFIFALPVHMLLTGTSKEGHGYANLEGDGGCVCGGGQPIMPTVWDVFEHKAGQLFASYRQRLEENQA